jgi:hypothetical protein
MPRLMCKRKPYLSITRVPFWQKSSKNLHKDNGHVDVNDVALKKRTIFLASGNWIMKDGNNIINSMILTAVSASLPALHLVTPVI